MDANAFAAFVDDESGRQQWPQVCAKVMQWAQSDDARMKECSMNLIENVPGLFGIDQNNGLDQIKQVRWTKMLSQRTLTTNFAGDAHMYESRGRRSALIRGQSIYGVRHR